MTVNFLKYFYDKNFNDKVVAYFSEKYLTAGDLLPAIIKKTDFLKNINETKILISAENNFEFLTNFVACALSQKEIVLSANNRQALQLKDIAKIPLTSDLSETNNCNKIEEKSPDCVFINIYTSGSGGDCKCIQKTLANLIEESFDIVEDLELQGSKNVISTTPYDHSFGLTVGFVMPLCCNFILNLNRINYPHEAEGKNSILVTTPSFVEQMRKSDEHPSIKLRHVISAGAELKREHFEYLKKISLSSTDIYGSTESGVISFRNSFGANMKPFRGIKIIPGTPAKIISNYAKISQRNSDDNFEIYPSGEFRLIGRSDRVLKIHEKRISAEEIEKKLTQHEFVNEAYCLKQGDKLATVVALSELGSDFVLKNSIPQLKMELKNYLLNFFEIVPQKFKFTAEIPKTSSGKIDKEKIEKIFDINMSYPLILERKVCENRAEFKIYFYRHCDFFKGHFEEFKLVAGVVQLVFATMLIQDVFGITCGSGQVRKIKFSNVILPDTIVNFSIEKHEKYVLFKYFNEDGNFSSGTFPIENVLRR